MLLMQVCKLLILLAVCSLGPGLLLARRLHWRPLETLAASIAISHFVLYLAMLAIYTLGLPLLCCHVVALLGTAAVILVRRDLAKLWADRCARQAIIAFLAVFAWVLLALLQIRHYSGGLWYGDWFEHYHRCRFFLNHEPLDTRFLDMYLLPARPPLMNLVGAYFLALAGQDFELFQIVFAFLNVLSVLGCCLILPNLLRGGGRSLLVLAALLALNPMFLQNATFTWTKLYAAFFVITGVAFYLAGWRRLPLPSPPGGEGQGVRRRMIAAFMCMALAVLVHYSAGPYVLFLAGHYLAVFWRRESRWRELAAIALAGACILATWFGWSCWFYGVRATFAHNTTVQGFTDVRNNPLLGLIDNTAATLIPYPLRGLPVLPMDLRDNDWATARDAAFVLYQTNLVAAFGSAGWAALGYLLFRAWQTGRRDQRLFWLAFTGAVIAISLFTYVVREPYGMAHLCLQPLILLGLTLIAAGLRALPRLLRLLYLASLLLDFAFGIALHISIQSVDYPASLTAGGWNVDTSPGLGAMAINNSLLKKQHNILFLGDQLAPLSLVLSGLTFIAGAAIIGCLLYISHQPTAEHRK